MATGRLFPTGASWLTAGHLKPLISQLCSNVFCVLSNTSSKLPGLSHIGSPVQVQEQQQVAQRRAEGRCGPAPAPSRAEAIQKTTCPQAPPFPLTSDPSTLGKHGEELALTRCLSKNLLHSWMHPWSPRGAGAESNLSTGRASILRLEAAATEAGPRLWRDPPTPLPGWFPGSPPRYYCSG